MKSYVTPNDTYIVGLSDSESIQNAVDYAAREGRGRVVIPRMNERTGKAIWDIEKAVILSSDIEIVLDNCLLRQADGVADNVFRSHLVNEDAQDISAELHDIRIIGKGRAVIDGGIHNGITESKYNKQNGIVPKTIIKDVINTLEITKKRDLTKDVKKQDIPEEIEKLKALMKIASQNLDFEKCIEIRDNIAKLKAKMRK